MADTQTDAPGIASLVVAANIKRLRALRGMTYVRLSQRLADVGRRIPVLGLRRIEHLERRVDVDDLVALAAALDVDVLRLMTPPACDACESAPPAGFTCNTCGRNGR